MIAVVALGDLIGLERASGGRVRAAAVGSVKISRLRVCIALPAFDDRAQVYFNLRSCRERRGYLNKL